MDLVIFNVTVTDSKGHLVKGLSKDDFRIFEDGQQQEIQFVHPEDIPATVGLVIDNSGSMRRKRSEVIGAALAFAESSNPHDELFIDPSLFLLRTSGPESNNRVASDADRSPD